MELEGHLAWRRAQLCRRGRSGRLRQARKTVDVEGRDRGSEVPPVSRLWEVQGGGMLGRGADQAPGR